MNGFIPSEEADACFEAGFNLIDADNGLWEHPRGEGLFFHPEAYDEAKRILHRRRIVDSSGGYSQS